MAGMGLIGMGGAAGAGDALANIQQQRMQAAQLAQQDALTRLKFQEQADAVQARLEASRQAQSDRVDAAKVQQQDRADRTAMLQFALTPVGASVDPTSAQAQIGAGIPSNLLPKTPGTPVQQTTGFMPLPSAPSTGPGLQTIQGLQPVNGSGAPPPPPSGPTMPPGGQSVTTAQPTSPLSVPDQFTRGQTQADVEKQKADTLAAAKPDATVEAARQRAQDREDQIRLAASLRPEPADHFTGQDRYVNGKPVAGRLNTKTGEWTPTPDVGPMHAEPGAAQQAQLDSRKKDALNTLGQLDQAIENAKDLIGPGAGRVSNLEQMIGNADPKVQALGTKMLFAKMQVDASIGGMRAAASPMLLARWDNLLANKVTPEGLKAAVQAMREILSSGATSGEHSASSADGGDWIDIGGGIKIRKKS